MARVILVVDTLRGFLEEGNPLYCGDRARRIVPAIKQLLERERAQGTPIIFLADRHAPDDPEFKQFAPHCVAGSRECEVIPELAEYAGIIIAKQHLNAFTDTSLATSLQQLGATTVVLCGVCTDICILYTACRARELGYEVEVPANCVATFDEKHHAFALEHMEKTLGVKITTALPSPPLRSDWSIPVEWLNGDTADVYFLRTVEILKKEQVNPVVTMEVFPRRDGILCGIEEVKSLLKQVLPSGEAEVWALDEGDSFSRKEVVLRITAPYQSFGVYETCYLGILAHCSGWATAARECVQAARGLPVLSFGARHVHPSVVAVMEYSAIVGGCTGCASTAGARLAGMQPVGTIPHALIIIMGSTAAATLAFDREMDPTVPRLALVDTFEDEVRESVAVAKAMKGRLSGVRLDTPSERGRVTAELVKEVRAWLDLEGFKDVRIAVSGGLDPDRIRYFLREGAPIDMFAVGSHISDTQPLDFTADLHEVDGRPIAKRGRMPGLTPNPRLKRVL
ncbi:MAG: nicotinate phosphoribosyltransferase [Dehalococcoidia bacterium]|nr:nicotinate phosphoribosyltransferase [Dehalococcoidia bacterium]